MQRRIVGTERLLYCVNVYVTVVHIITYSTIQPSMIQPSTHPSKRFSIGVKVAPISLHVLDRSCGLVLGDYRTQSHRQSVEGGPTHGELDSH